MRRAGAVSVSGVILFAVLCIALISLLSSPAGAQQAADPLEGQTAEIGANAIGPIAIADCEEAEGETASIIVADANDAAKSETFTEGTDAVFQFGAQGVTINTEEDGNLRLASLRGSRTGEVVSSEGITCADDGRQRADDDDARDDDNRENLSCDDLLVLFRGEGQGQYGDDEDAIDLNDSEVRAQIEVCLEKEIVNNPGGDLPNTGGLSLIGLAALGAAAAVVGLSVIRGGRR
jgi:hypothetical protein